MKKYLILPLLALLADLPLFAEEHPSLTHKNIYTQSTAEEKLFQAILTPSAYATQEIITKENLQPNKIRIKGISLLQWAAFFSTSHQTFIPSQQCSIDLEGVLRVLLFFGDDINHVAFKPKDYKPDNIHFVPDGYTFLGNALRVGNFFFIRVALDAEKMNPRNKLNISWRDDNGNTYLHMLTDPTNKTIHTDLYAEHILARPSINISQLNMPGETSNQNPELKRLRSAAEGNASMEAIHGGKAIDNNKMKVTQTVTINDLVLLFLKKGIDVNAQNKQGDTALHIALRATKILDDNKFQACKIEENPNPELKDKVIYYKDYYANAIINLQLVIRELLAANADLNIANKAGETPLMIAKSIKDDIHPVRIIMDLAEKGKRPLNADQLKQQNQPQDDQTKTQEAKPQEPQAKPKADKPNRYRPSQKTPRLHLDL